MLDSILKWFWNPAFWLPVGYSWEDFDVDDGIRRPHFSDLYVTPVLVLGFILLRFIFERFIALRFCQCIGISDASNLPEANGVCESTFFYATKKPDQAKIKDISLQIGWPPPKTTRWFRKMRSAKTNSLLKKATETCWRFFIYFGFFVYGAFVLLRTDWFYDTDKWMEGYLRTQELTPEIRWYYLIELSFYISLLVTQLYDTKRKDFWQQFVHHNCTIILILGSWTIGHFRFGIVIMFVHDTSDYWLEAAKIANYAKVQKICDSLFIVFAINFFLSRWVFFPFWVMKTFITDNAKICGPLQSYFTFPYIFLYINFVLMFLHIYWGYLIGRMIYRFTVEGKVEKDDRSDPENSDGSD
jgi:hypothetical protein